MMSLNDVALWTRRIEVVSYKAIHGEKQRRILGATADGPLQNLRWGGRAAYIPQSSEMCVKYHKFLQCFKLQLTKFKIHGFKHILFRHVPPKPGNFLSPQTQDQVSAYGEKR